MEKNNERNKRTFTCENFAIRQIACTDSKIQTCTWFPKNKYLQF